MANEETKKPKAAEAETVSAHLPPPPTLPALPASSEDVLYYWSAKDADLPGREFEDIMLRRVPAAVAHQFRGAAGARGLTHAQYLTALVALHEAMRTRADAGNAEMAAALDELGLRTVSI